MILGVNIVDVCRVCFASFHSLLLTFCHDLVPCCVLLVRRAEQGSFLLYQDILLTRANSDYHRSGSSWVNVPCMSIHHLKEPQLDLQYDLKYKNQY